MLAILVLTILILNLPSQCPLLDVFNDSHKILAAFSQGIFALYWNCACVNPFFYKFFFFQFLLFVIGFFNGRIVKYKKFMFFYTLTALFFTFIFKWRLYDQTLVFAPIMILVMALGLEKVLSWKTPRKLLFFGFALGEFLLFRSLLMKGFLM